MKINFDKNLNNNFQPCETNVDYLFPIPFLSGQLKLDHQRVRQDMDRLIDQVADRHGDDNLSNYTTYFDGDIREQMHLLPWWTSFVNQMKDTYILFVKNVFESDVDYLSRHDIHFFAWMNRYDSHHSHEVHNHVNSLMSGTYYVDVDEDSQPIKFFNPSVTTIFGHQAGENQHQIQQNEKMTYTGTSGSLYDMTFKAQSGDFALWPSYLMHCVPPDNTQKESYTRYSISFNLNHSKNLGSYTEGDQMSYDFLGRESE